MRDIFLFCFSKWMRFVRNRLAHEHKQNKLTLLVNIPQRVWQKVRNKLGLRKNNIVFFFIFEPLSASVRGTDIFKNVYRKDDKEKGGFDAWKWKIAEEEVIWHFGGKIKSDEKWRSGDKNGKGRGEETRNLLNLICRDR